MRRIVFVLLFAGRALAQTSDEQAKRVDAVFAAYRDTPGCAVGVARGGTPILTRAYGMANLEYEIPLTPNSIFEAGSVTKQFTAAAIVLLAQDGKLSLDDHIRKYIPELSDSAEPVTIRQMLNHTSGLRDWGTMTSLAGWRRGTRAHTHAIVLDILSRQRALNFPAGTQFSYSNSNYNLLAIVVERVSGQSFPAFTNARIFTPLGMTRSSWRDDYARVVKGRATAYDPVKGGGFEADMDHENIYGNCCLLTTVSDLLLWNENFKSGRVGGKALVDALQTPGVLTTGEKIDYALGLFILDYHGKPEISHSGSTAGYRAYLARLPDDDLSIAVLCNRGDANAPSLGHKVADVFLPPAPEVAPASATDTNIEQFAGLYRDPLTDALLPIKVEKNALRIGFDRSFEITPLGSARYRIRPTNEVQFDHGGLLLFTGHKQPARYVRVAQASPSAAALEEYVGLYTSEEVGNTYRISLVDGKLNVRVRPGMEIP
ncbi:MAG TPA: serine hydrolase domain-containing protein, partial [Thermoanaerobaculia bacterium]